jgi:hypothetical protein
MALACGIFMAARPAVAQINVYRLANMSFGPVVAGTSKQIQPTEASAGRFQITALPGVPLSIAFTLPSALELGGSNLTISFGSTDAAWSGNSNVGAATRFDPRQPLEVTMPLSGSVYLWIGGGISPHAVQPTGAHSGTITVSVTLVPL